MKLITLLLILATAGAAQCTSSQKYIVNCQTGARVCVPIYDSTPVCQTPIVVASLPSTCSIGDMVSLNTGTVGSYFCNPANTWTQLGSGSSVTAFQSLTDASPITWAVNTTPNAYVTLAHTLATRALNVTGITNGGFYIIKLIQDSTGGAALTLGTGCTWKVANGGSGAVTLSSAANAVDSLTFFYDGTACYATFTPNYN